MFQPETEWADPLPLSRDDDVPPFPVDALPAWLRDFIEAEATFTQTPTEMPAMFCLGALAAVCGGRVWIEGARGWTEGTNLYVAVVAAPGTRKTPVHRACCAPVLEYERALIDATREDVERRRAEREAREMMVERAREAMGRAKDAASSALAVRDYTEARAALALAPGATEPRIVVGDVTPEALIELLAEQDGRLAMLSDEDTLIGHLLGRYSASPAIEAFLTAYSNAPLSRDRKGKPPVRIPRPALTIATPIQPALLERARGDAMVTGRGLLDRFAMVVPANLIGSRRVDAPPVSDAVVAAYRENVIAVAAAAERANGRTLGLSPVARRIFTRWRVENERELGPGGRLEDVSGWGAKSEGLCLRFAALLHLAERPGHGLDLDVSEAAVRGGIEIVRCLGTHALVASDVLGIDRELADARTLLAWARDRGPTFTIRDAKRNLRRLKRGDALMAAIRILEERGIVRRLPRDVGQPGRPSEVFMLHPRSREIEVSGGFGSIAARSRATATLEATADHDALPKPPEPSDAWSDEKCRDELDPRDAALHHAATAAVSG